MALFSLGLPNRKVLRNSFMVDGINFDDVVSCYRQWLASDVFVHFRDENGLDWKMLSPKRGNRQYSVGLYKRFLRYKEAFGKLVGATSFEVSRVMLVTLTLRRSWSIADAWINIGAWCNLFFTKIRQKYKGCKIFRTWEVHKDLYPHVHALIVLNNDFKINKRRVRHGWKYVVEDKIRDDIKSKWNLGWVDVTGVVDLYQAFSYIAKYAVKAAFSPERNYDKLAILWLFGKRAWSVSRGIDLIRSEINSKVVCLGLSDKLGVFHSFVKDVELSKLRWASDSPFVLYLLSKHLIVQQLL